MAAEVLLEEPTASMPEVVHIIIIQMHVPRTTKYGNCSSSGENNWSHRLYC